MWEWIDSEILYDLAEDNEALIDVCNAYLA